MSRQQAGYIGFNRVPAASAANSAASGLWTLREAEAMRRAGTWPTAPSVVATIAGLQLWLDAADASTLFNATSGGSLVAADGGVARWEDKSGNARHATQSTSGNRPLRKTAIQGGLDVLRLDGVNDSLATPAFHVSAANGYYTAFIVAATASTAATASALHFVCQDNSSVSPRTFQLFRRNGDKLQSVWFNNFSETSAIGVVEVSISANTFFCGSVSVGDGVAMRKNGILGATVLSAPTTSIDRRDGSLFIGARTNQIDESSALDFVQGDICEIIIYNSALSDANRSAVESYLMTKWGIT